MSTGRLIKIARSRRCLTAKTLAEKAGVTAVAISNIENGVEPKEATLIAIANALEYDVEFFRSSNAVEIDAETVSFRSLKKMSAKERDRALGAGSLGVTLYDWLASEFDLPDCDLPNLSHEAIEPEMAARIVRSHWRLGEKPISNVLRLLEAKGVRILSLSEQNKHVDAYSFWKQGNPYMFLNQFKSAEHSVFDSAHELGHLILHRHAGPDNKRDAEMEADRFASSFLMPSSDVRSTTPSSLSMKSIIRMKKRWKVSALAYVRRLYTLKLISEWNYRGFCIELSRNGYRSAEPDGIERELSRIWDRALRDLWEEGYSRNHIEEATKIPLDEIDSLVFGLLPGDHERVNRVDAPVLRLAT